MDVDIARFGDAQVRLKRVHGQAGEVIQMIEEGRDCSELVPQLAAAARALDRAGFEVIATVMRQCVAAGDEGTRSLDEAQLERLFLSLA